MKPRHILIYCVVFFGMGLLGLVTILKFNTSLNIGDILLPSPISFITDISTYSCSNRPVIPNLEQSEDPQLTKLYEYQEICGSFLTGEMMFFIDMPKDKINAKSKAEYVAGKLKEFAKFNVKPIVIIEPVTEWGLIDFVEFDSGFYDTWIDTFFSEIKTLGITDTQMGTWVPFPEANLPYWNRSNATPEQFGLVVNRYLRIMKKYFPEALGSILLNSATYETTDFEWENGEYISLSSYVSLIDKTLISSFGIQGFPWRNNASAKKDVTLYDARQFINPDIAIEAANIIGTKNIWLNTGTFGSKFTLDPNETVFIDYSTRKDILDDILKQAKYIKNKGYSVSVNLFSEDKSATNEATNWSYWGNYTNLEDPNIFVFKSFASKLIDSGIGFTLFDTSTKNQADPVRELR